MYKLSPFYFISLLIYIILPGCLGITYLFYPSPTIPMVFVILNTFLSIKVYYHAKSNENIEDYIP